MDLISSFSQESAEARQKILLELANTFHPSDWWYLESLLQKRVALRYDILGNLPIELTLLVARHLPPADLCQARRVSRRWHAIFTSNPVCHESVLTWYPDGLAEMEDAGLPSASSGQLAIYRNAFDILASRKHLLSQARPLDAYVLRLHLPREFKNLRGRHLDNFDYAGGKIFFAASDSMHLSHLDRKLKWYWKLKIPNREPVFGYAMTDKILAAITVSRQCLVWDTTLAPFEFPLKTLRLQNSINSCIFAEKAIVVIYQKEVGNAIVWDTEADTVNLFENLPCGLGNMTLFHDIHHHGHLLFVRFQENGVRLSDVLIGKISLETGQAIEIKRVDHPRVSSLEYVYTGFVKASPTSLVLYTTRNVEAEMRRKMEGRCTHPTSFHHVKLVRDLPGEEPLKRFHVLSTRFIDLRTEIIFEQSVCFETGYVDSLFYRYWRHMLIILIYGAFNRVDRLYFYNLETRSLARRYFELSRGNYDEQIAFSPVWAVDDEYLVIDPYHDERLVVFKWGDLRGGVPVQVPWEWTADSRFSCKECEAMMGHSYVAGYGSGDIKICEMSTGV